MGLAAEQDTYLLDEFRPLLHGDDDVVHANIVQVYPGSNRPDDPPLHFLLLENCNPEYMSSAKLAASESMESLVSPNADDLVRLYFKNVHPVLPVISKARFLSAYLSDKRRIPASLRGAVYALACPFWDRTLSSDQPCRFSQWKLVDFAHDALRREHENLNLFTLQACLLLHHLEAPQSDSVETSSIWTLTAQATACAQMLGLHCDPGRWSLEPWEKRLRKKLWWATFWADCWSSVCHGTPPHLGRETFNTLPPDMDDALADEKVPSEASHLVEIENPATRALIAARFLETVKLAMILRDVLDCGL